MDNTATGGGLNEEKERLLTSSRNPPDIRYKQFCIIDKENYVSRDNSVKNIYEKTSILRIKTLKPWG